MSIPLYSPHPEISILRDEIDAAISAVIDHGQFIMGPEVQEFETNVASFLGVKHAIGVNSGTDALVIALDALGIGDGDEVITTPMSYIATAESISRVGGKPIFVDIEPDSFNIDPEKIESRISNRTKAILPVHLFGRPANMDRIVEIAESNDLKILEDCAQSFGADYQISVNKSEKKMTGSIGDAGAFSFFPTKNLGSFGDGGMITTNSDEVAEKARMLRVHGARKKYFNERLGYNSRLDTIQAAILDIKLKHVEEFNQKRRTVAEFYNQELSKLEMLQTPEITSESVFHQYTIQVLNGKRDALKHFLQERNISTNIYFPVPLNELPVYQHQEYPILPIAHKMAQQTLSLPIWPHIETKTLKTVSEAVQAFFTSK